MAQLKNTTINDTGFLQLPSGTTAQRPGSAAAGQMRYNSDTNSVEWYDAEYSSWFPAGVITPVATGGTVANITQGGVGYRVHSFTSVGTSTFTVTRSGPVEFLIVAGGGGGGGSTAGGGGAGGVLQGMTSVTAQIYNIIVGAGGLGTVRSDQGGPNNTEGKNSSAFNYTAIGGGKGYSGKGSGNPPTLATAGGSGGGGGGYSSGNAPTFSVGGQGTPGQGNSGGVGTSTGNWGGAGGGGAGGPGADQGESPNGIGTIFPRNGGVGISSSIAGSIQFYGGGGGGGTTTSGRSEGGLGGGGQGAAGNDFSTVAGTNGLGGGGGGGGYYQNGPGGAAGGSGVVIIRYRTS